MLDGLHYAHELKDFDGKPLGVIHRDVTPSNVFVKYDGLTKLVDFGIAKSATQFETKTRAGMLKGKIGYMAPEQLRDDPVTRAADVWAAAIVLWETLVGERLFRGKNDFETVQSVMLRSVPVKCRLDAERCSSIAGRSAGEGDRARSDETSSDRGRAEGPSGRRGGEDWQGPAHQFGRQDDVPRCLATWSKQNKRLVKAFLEEGIHRRICRSTPPLRMRTSGALEVREW